jgi:ribosome-binding factor A
MAKNRHHEGSGPSQRQLRVGELIRRTLSGVLARGEVHDPELNALSITVGEVRASPDLKIATVYVMPLGGGGREDAIAALKRNRGELRRALMREMTLKYAPDLRFVIDDTFDRMDDTRRLFEMTACAAISRPRRRRGRTDHDPCRASGLGLLTAPEAMASECERLEFEGARFTACTVDMQREDVRLFLRDPRARSTARSPGSRPRCRRARRWSSR